MQTLFSLNELITASENKLSINTIKDYCRRGELHPCIYFEGNIVCIYDERHQNSIDKRDPITHIENVKWARKFKGYISASNFIDYIAYTTPNESDVFFNVEKIIEHISPINDFPALQKDEYLKAFPPFSDDDIQEKRWSLEIRHFTGNVFRAEDIVFHVSEVEKILIPSKNINGIRFLDYTDKPFLTRLFRQEYFTLIEAACLISMDDPDVIELLYTNKRDKLEQNYPKNYDALILIQRAIEMGVLKTDISMDIPQLELAEFLVNRGYIIKNFNLRNYEGNYAPYFIALTGNPRPIPKVLDFTLYDDPLSEINYLRFKVNKLEDENRKLTEANNQVVTNMAIINSQINDDDISKYSTPALEAMRGVIKEFWLTYDVNKDIAPKQSTIMAWIAESYPEYSENDYMKKAIDKLCRHPKAKLGGNSKLS
ncbi:TPA: hypothetical protein JI227_11795 [Acinetobacter baumannii]|nr:hypothetical protein [Acinetobacter baumannii]